MIGPVPEDDRRFMPPALRAALEEAAPETVAGPLELTDEEVVCDIPPSRTWRFFHARAWKYALAWVSLLIIMVLFGMMCSPAYWRF